MPSLVKYNPLPVGRGPICCTHRMNGSIAMNVTTPPKNPSNVNRAAPRQSARDHVSPSRSLHRRSLRCSSRRSSRLISNEDSVGARGQRNPSLLRGNDGFDDDDGDEEFLPGRPHRSTNQRRSWRAQQVGAGGRRKSSIPPLADRSESESSGNDDTHNLLPPTTPQRCIARPRGSGNFETNIPVSTAEQNDDSAGVLEAVIALQALRSARLRDEALAGLQSLAAALPASE